MDQENKLWTKNFILVSISNFLLFISFYALMVTLAVYSIDKFHASESEAGLASSIFVLGAVLVRPVAGKLIDRLGKNKMLFFGLLLFLFMMLLYFPINSLTLLLLVRFIHGFAFGIATNATSTIAAHIIPVARRGEGMGYFATSMNMAMAIGPFLGLWVSRKFNYPVMFTVTTILSILALLTVFFLSITEVKKNKVPVEKNEFRLSGYFEKTTIPIAVFMCILGFVYSSILSFLDSYTSEIKLEVAASFFFVMYAVFLILSRPFTGKLYDLKGENIVIYPSIIFLSIGYLILSQAHHGLTFLLAGALIGVSFGTIQSSAQAIMLSRAPHDRLGVATSTFFVFYDFGVGIGPFILGYFLPYTGFRDLYIWMAATVFGCLLIYYIVHGKNASKLRKPKEYTREKTVSSSP